MFLIFSCLLLFIGSLTFTGLFRRYATLDIPNERSAHSTPTPRGGGLVFVLFFLLFLLICAYLQVIDTGLFLSLLLPGALIATIGFVDDRRQVSALKRLTLHFLAASIALYCIGGFPSIFMLGHFFHAGLILNILGLIYLVWMINLYNFMDGINGLAALEAISICLGGASLSWLHGEYQAMYLPLGLAAAVGGFLYWNFPIARIFMGDVGSGFTGLILALLSLQAGKISPDLLWAWLILSGVFIVDATFTLLARAISGQSIVEAHSHHAYQHAAQQRGRHAPVSIAVLLINLLWLLPMAVLVASHWLDGFAGLLLAYIPLIILAWRFNAGCCRSRISN